MRIPAMPGVKVGFAGSSARRQRAPSDGAGESGAGADPTREARAGASHLRLATRSAPAARIAVQRAVVQRYVATLGSAVILGFAVILGCAGGSTRDVTPESRAGTTQVRDASSSVAFPSGVDSARAEAFLDTLAERTFRFFWDHTEPHTGLCPDRWPTRSFTSVAATGFALTAWPIGVERGYVSREDGARRALTTLRFLWEAPQDSAISGSTGFRGHFYHFLEPETGTRFGDVELSTVDSALLLAGALFCQSYFDGASAAEGSVRALAESLYVRADWNWAQVRPPAIGHGWKPESGHLPYDWRGYNEALILYILALGSPSHPIGPEAWEEWTSRYRWGEFYGYEHLGFAPLFGHQYSHVWIDFRGIQDDYMRERGIDYFENSRRATLAQHAYATENPAGWVGYGPRSWGLTACDGPADVTLRIGGRERKFETYWARGASFTDIHDDGTLCPSAAGGAIVFAPEIVIPALIEMRETHGSRLFGEYGFFDAFNPTFTADVPVQHGRVHGDHGWYDTDYLGIDQGPILAMIENRRSGLIWKTLRRNPHVIRGLIAAGFTGGWLDSVEVSR